MFPGVLWQLSSPASCCGHVLATQLLDECTAEKRSLPLRLRPTNTITEETLETFVIFREMRPPKNACRQDGTSDFRCPINQAVDRRGTERDVLAADEVSDGDSKGDGWV